MPKPNSVWWSESEGCWLSSVGGEISEKSGRRKPLRNREIGAPSGPDKSKNHRLALEWFEGLVEKAESQVRATKEPVLAYLVERYLDEMADKLAPRTLVSHKERLLTFSAFVSGRGPLGHRPIRDLRPGDLARFIKQKLSEGCGPVYINSILISVNACLNWAARPIDGRIPERYLKENPFAGTERPKNPAPPKRYVGPVAHAAFFEYALVRACLRHSPDSAGWRFDRLSIALFRFCQITACRPSEACRLEWSHIDWGDATARMDGKTTKKTGDKRSIPIPSPALAILRAIEKLPGRHPRFVFTHMKRGGEASEFGVLAGVPWVVNALDHKFRAWRDEAIEIGCPIQSTGNSALTLYALRRDLGAEILRLRGSHADSAEVLGHSAELNARYYASFAREHALGLAEQVAQNRKNARINPDPNA